VWIDGADLGNEVSTWSNEGEGKLQQHRRWRCRPRDRPIELLAKGRQAAKFLGSTMGHHNVRQGEGGGHTLEEDALSRIRLQQGELHLGHGDRHRHSGQTTPAPDIDHAPDSGPGYSQQGIARGDLRQDLFHGARTGEVDAAVPIKEQRGVALDFRPHILTILGMPIYEFSCLSCRHTFDVFGGFASRDQRQVCPECESTNTKAMFSTFAVVGSSQASSASTSGGCACGGSCSCSN